MSLFILIFHWCPMISLSFHLTGRFFNKFPIVARRPGMCWRRSWRITKTFTFPAGAAIWFPALFFQYFWIGLRCCLVFFSSFLLGSNGFLPIFNDFVGCADFWSLFYWFSNVSHRSFNDFMDYLMIFSDLLDDQSILVDFYSTFEYCLSFINGFSTVCKLVFHWIISKWFHCYPVELQ